MFVGPFTRKQRSVLWALLSFILPCSGILLGQIRFEESGQSAGLWTSFRSYGVSVTDYDQDGWDDILFVGPSGVALFRNNRNTTFTDVTQTAGLTFSAHFVIGLWVDWDNDGDQDLFLGRRDTNDRNRILRNDGGVFTDVAAGIDPFVRIGSAAAGDYDNDGRVDLYLSTRDVADHLYRNVSAMDSIAFDDVSESSGMKGISYSIGMQPTWIDYDQDGDQDLFVVHDGTDLSRLHTNTGELPFPNLAAPLAIADVGAGNSMGVSWGDVNNDGWQDVYVSRINRGGLYRNSPGGPFEDIAGPAGADSNGMAWGVVFADFDNDGAEDIAIVNVSSFGGAHPLSLLFRNNRDGTFSDIGSSSGFAVRQDMYGLASGDFDNDGRVDLVGASDSPAGENRLWMNRTSNTNTWIRIRLEGGGGVNTMAIGTRIRAITEGQTFVRSVFAGSSYCSQMSPVLHVGLGSSLTIDTLEIFWQGGHREIHTNLPTDSLYTFQREHPTGVNGDNTPSIERPTTVRILSVYPNPFNSSTRLLFDQEREGRVRISVVDLLGREIHLVLDDVFGTGEHAVSVRMTGAPSGMYIARIQTPAYITTTPILLVR